MREQVFGRVSLQVSSPAFERVQHYLFNSLVSCFMGCLELNSMSCCRKLIFSNPLAPGLSQAAAVDDSHSVPAPELCSVICAQLICAKLTFILEILIPDLDFFLLGFTGFVLHLNKALSEQNWEQSMWIGRSGEEQVDAAETISAAGEGRLIKLQPSGCLSEVLKSFKSEGEQSDAER